MSPIVKTILYAAALACLIVFAVKFRNTYAPQAGGSAVVATNQPGATNVTATNFAAAATNLAVTNLLATNAAAATTTDEIVERRAAEPLGLRMTYGGLALLGLIMLGLLIGREVSHFLANRAEKFLFNDDLVGVTDPEYEEAEKLWTNGQHLEAVQRMRDYLKRHPRELHVALRIAEIYEKDIGNYLAAALEYEELLRKRLPPERWGWAAIHLANLYTGKLNKNEQATKLLRRIADEYAQTAAAKKARERLGIPEPVEEVQAPEPPPPAPAPVVVKVRTAPPEPEKKPEEPAKPKLPPGFRPK